MEQLIAGIPLWAVWAYLGVHVFTVILFVGVWWELEETDLETLGEGLLGFTLFFDVPSIFLKLSLLFIPLGIWSAEVGGAVFRMILGASTRGFGFIASTLLLLAVEKIYANKTGKSFKDMATSTLLIFGLFALVVNLGFWILPLSVLSLFVFAPLIIAPLTSGLLLWKVGYPKLGGSFELLTFTYIIPIFVLFGTSFMKVFRGVDPKIPGFMIIAFLVLQILGPLALYFMSRKE